MAHRTYQHNQLIVFWDSDLCIHCGECEEALPEVFKPSRRPWVDLSKALPEDIRQTVAECPSGALSLGPAE